MRITHRIDRFKSGTVHTWLLDGVSKEKGSRLEKLGWSWLDGEPGCWETSDKSLAKSLIDDGVPCYTIRMGKIS